jgi:hypothetical protein
VRIKAAAARLHTLQLASASELVSHNAIKTCLLYGEYLSQGPRHRRSQQQADVQGLVLLCAATTVDVQGLVLLCAATTVDVQGLVLLCAATTVDVQGLVLLCAATTVRRGASCRHSARAQ